MLFWSVTTGLLAVEDPVVPAATPTRAETASGRGRKIEWLACPGDCCPVESLRVPRVFSYPLLLPRDRRCLRSPSSSSWSSDPLVTGGPPVTVPVEDCLDFGKSPLIAPVRRDRSSGFFLAATAATPAGSSADRRNLRSPSMASWPSDPLMMGGPLKSRWGAALTVASESPLLEGTSATALASSFEVRGPI